MITSVRELLDMFMNFIYTMGLLPVVQGFFIILAIIAMVAAISKLRQ